MRTTLDIDAPVLAELKKLQKIEKISLGKLASRLLSVALAHEQKSRPSREPKWIAKPMGCKADLGDKDAVYRILDSPDEA